MRRETGKVGVGIHSSKALILAEILWIRRGWGKTRGVFSLFGLTAQLEALYCLLHAYIC
jgi:hypothetical protein